MSFGGGWVLPAFEESFKVFWLDAIQFIGKGGHAGILAGFGVEMTKGSRDSHTILSNCY